MSRKFLLVSVILGHGVVASAKINDGRPDKPNVVFILADDLGWQDVKCYDIDEPSPFETPNIDYLSRQGVLFTQAYSPAPTSSPSRGALLTGKHPVRLQRTHVVGGSPILPNSSSSPMMSPWYSGRLSEDEITIPEMLKNSGYVSGHAGKWHVAIDHNAFPQPKDQGFDFSEADRGVTERMRPNRLNDFASTNKNDIYCLDENGFPYDSNTANALNFIEKNKDKPFFLYYATWLVHTPIQTRSKILLEKYCKKMGVPFPTNPNGWNIEGQKNPYYGAMVEMLDYYVGLILNYLSENEDPRWKGHKLIENTYIIFTSDNGGMEVAGNEMITDNAPLDKGKIYVQEGGIRVPMIIAGPGIKKDVRSDVLVSGLDIFPTIMHWTCTDIPQNQIIDGCDIDELLREAPNDMNRIKYRNGEVRQYLIHHFPHNMMQSSIIIGGYKLIRNYYVGKKQYELYKLYTATGERVDIEERNDIAEQNAQLVDKMSQLLNNKLEEMNAQYPYKNPKSPFYGKNVKTCSIAEESCTEGKAKIKIIPGNAPIQKVLLLYTLNGNQKHEEWFQTNAVLDSEGYATAILPKGTTHYVWSIIDSENFLVNYPEMGDMRDYKNGNYAIQALTVK